MRPEVDEPADRPLTGLILAGGQGQRMGGADKGLVDFAGQPMIAHVIARLRPQVDTVLISANRNHDRYAAFGYPVLPDSMPDYAGPLAGILSGLEFCRAGAIVTVPCDSPFLPATLAARLAAAARGDDEIAVVHARGELQPVFALIPVGLRRSLAAYLASGGRKIAHWYREHSLVIVDFGDCNDAFENINTGADHRAAVARAASIP